MSKDAYAAHEHFSDEEHTQGNQPHLMQYLRLEFVAALTRKAEKDSPEVDPDKIAAAVAKAVARTTADQFIRWASAFMKVNRGVETTFIDANMGIRLTNNAIVALSPGIEIRGTMQDDHSVGVTKGGGKDHHRRGDGAVGIH